MSAKYDISLCTSSTEKTSKWGTTLEQHIELFLNKKLNKKIVFNHVSLDIKSLKRVTEESSAVIIVVDNESKIIKQENPLGNHVFEVHIQKGLEESGLSPRIAYRFFDISETENELIANNNKQDPAPNQEQYWNKLIDLSFDIHTELSGKSTNHLKSIFLAKTSEDQQNKWDMLRRNFLHLGYDVLPKQQLSKNADTLKIQLKEAIEKSVLCIHIIGKKDTIKIDGSTRNLVSFQNKIASEISRKTNISRLIWAPPDLKPNSDQKIKIEKLKRNSEELSGAEVVEVPIEMLKVIASNKLNSITEMENNDPPKKNIAKKKVYLISENEDIDTTKLIASTISNYGIEVKELKNEGNNDTHFSEHKKNLIEADAYLIYTNKKTNQYKENRVNNFTLFFNIITTMKNYFLLSGIILLFFNSVNASLCTFASLPFTGESIILLSGEKPRTIP